MRKIGKVVDRIDFEEIRGVKKGRERRNIKLSASKDWIEEEYKRVRGEEKKDLHIKIPYDLYEELERVAREERMSRSALLTFLIRIGLRDFKLWKEGGKGR